MANWETAQRRSAQTASFPRRTLEPGTPLDTDLGKIDERLEEATRAASRSRTVISWQHVKRGWLRWRRRRQSQRGIVTSAAQPGRPVAPRARMKQAQAMLVVSVRT